jgi:arsenite methyltransferase
VTLDRWAEWLVSTRFAGMAEDEVTAALAELGRSRDRVLEAAAITRGATGLDLGAGTGLLTVGAAAHAGVDGDVYAVDVSVDALDALRRSEPAPTIWYLIGEAEVLPLPDEFVDVAVTRSVLIHVDDLRRVVAELRRVLRRGGRISLFEPLNRRGTYLHDVVDWSPLGELGERELLERAGFDDVRAELETVDDPWSVTDEGIEARLDAVGAPGLPTRRERWQSRYTPDEVDTLVGHLRSLAGSTLPLRWVHLWLTARVQ